jgi:putative transposase
MYHYTTSVMGDTTNPNEREQSGIAIATRPDQIKRIDENWYQVKAQSLKVGSWYDVVFTENGFVCYCPDNQWRKAKCKHIHAVEFSLKLRKEVSKQTVRIEPITKYACPHCNSENIRKFGLRKNKSGHVQRYACIDCKKTFSVNLGFEGMKASPQIITSALQLYFTGESLRNVQKFLRLQGAEVTHVTIYNWIKKYTGLMEKYLEKITPQVGEVWRADEIYLKVKGDKKYLYAMMDDETRFWIAKQVADTKYNEDIKPMFRDARQLTKAKPKVLITDGAQNFHIAYKKEYFTISNPRTKHIRHIHLQKDRNNNKMERLNGEIRDREKVMRGLKKMDTPIIEGYRIYHNYVRPHMALDGRTPAEKAGITIEGDNKWITIIQNASKQ